MGALSLEGFGSLGFFYPFTSFYKSCYSSVPSCEMSLIQDVHEPDNAEEAMSYPHWRKAMVTEMSSIEDNGTWRLVPRPTHKKLIGEVDFQGQVSF